MADYFAGNIYFPEWALHNPEVKKTLVDTFGDPSNWTKDYDMDKINGVIGLYDPQARYGGFEDVQNCFEAFKVPYDQWNDSFADISSSTVKYRPELKESIEFDGLSGDFLISASAIERILDKPDLKKELQKLLPPKVKELYDYAEPKNFKNFKPKDSVR